MSKTLRKVSCYSSMGQHDVLCDQNYVWCDNGLSGMVVWGDQGKLALLTLPHIEKISCFSMNI